MIINYGYRDAQGEYRITVDTDKCNGCGACAEICPENIFELEEDDYDEIKVVVITDKINKIGYLCPGAAICASRQGKNCHDVCPNEAMSHSW